MAMVDEGDKSVRRTGSPAHPGLVKPANPHRESLKLFLDQIPIDVIQVTAQITLRQDGQVVHSIDEKHSFRKIVFLGQPAKKLGR